MAKTGIASTTYCFKCACAQRGDCLRRCLWSFACVSTEYGYIMCLK